jgi:MFS family permease
MQSQHTIAAPHLGASAPSLPRLSRRAGFWAVAFAFLVVTAFSTAPGALYGLYERHEQLSSLTITLVYAVYAVGVITSLLLVGHLSDVYGRKPLLITAVAVATVAAVLFISWHSLVGLLVARVLTGLALGAAVATATAYIADLDTEANGAATRRSGIVATIANVGGLAIGPLVTGLLARYAPDALTLPYVVLLVGLVLAALAIAIAPEGRQPIHPRPAYRPQELKAPARGRRQFFAAIAGVALAFGTAGLFAGLSGTFLAGPLHHPSPALAGAVIFLAFASGVVVQTTTTGWPAHRLLTVGIAPLILGLAVVVVSAWATPPSLGLFIIGGVLVGIGVGAIFRGSLTVVISASRADDRAGALAMFFAAGYAGLSLPVLGMGVALQYLSPRVTLLIFGLAVGLGILAAAPTLVRPATLEQEQR